jgi:hydrogenase maturation factor HypF (carbamoyltransferase family)
MLKIKPKRSKIKNRDSFKISIKSGAVSRSFKVFIQRAAERRDIKGILNDESYGISMNVEGDKDKIYDLVSKIYQDKPHYVVIESIDVDKVEYNGYPDFKIPDDTNRPEHSLSLLDTAICPDCVEELFNPKSRRYLYPFISCSHCGLRLSLIKEPPYERANTIMSGFQPCSKCIKEYQDQTSRRFCHHTNSCWECGPKLSLKHRDSLGEYNYQGKEALDKVLELLKRGVILVYKDISGYKVCADISFQESAIILQDSIKEIESCIMLRGVKSAESYARINDKERELLLSYRRPKLLLRLLEDSNIPDKIKRERAYFKFQLPYSGLDYAIFKNIDSALLVKDCAALTFEDISQRLQNRSWAFLSDDRESGIYLQDSEVRVFISKDGVFCREILIKRSRGYLLEPLTLKRQFSSPILALGGGKEYSFALAQEDRIYPGPYAGDISREFRRANYKKSLELYMKILNIKPDIIAVEKGTEPYLNILAEELSRDSAVRVIEVDSDHARVISSSLNGGLDNDLIGAVLKERLKEDAIFDLKFYLNSLSDFKILAYFEPLEGLSKIDSNNNIRNELSLDLKDEFCNDSYPVELRELDNKFIILSSPILEGIESDIKMAIPNHRITAKLYNTIALGIYKLSLRLRKRLKIDKISLAGCMLENFYVLTNIYGRLKSKGFQVYIPESTAFGDSCIALGQSIVADSIIKEERKRDGLS